MTQDDLHVTNSFSVFWEITRGIIFCVIIPTRALLNKIFSDGKLLCELLDVLIPRCFAKNGIRFHKSEQALRHSEYQCSGRFSNWNISHRVKKISKIISENKVVKPASIWNSFSENINWFLDILNKEFKIRWDYEDCYLNGRFQFRVFKNGWC